MKGTVVSVAMEQHEAGDVSVGHRALCPDLVAGAGDSEYTAVQTRMVLYINHTTYAC